jgi:hypothetical protein
MDQIIVARHGNFYDSYIFKTRKVDCTKQVWSSLQLGPNLER